MWHGWRYQISSVDDLASFMGIVRMLYDVNTFWFALDISVCIVSRAYILYVCRLVCIFYTWTYQKTKITKNIHHSKYISSDIRRKHMFLSFSFNALFLHIVPSCFPASIFVLACLQWLALQPSDPEVETIVFQPPFLEGELLVSGRVNNWRLTYTFPRIYMDEILMMSNHIHTHSRILTCPFRNTSWKTVCFPLGMAN